MIHTLENVIKEHPFFQDLPDHLLEVIAGCAKNVQFPEGQVLLRGRRPRK